MIWQWGGVEETDNPGEREGIIRTAIGNDEVKDRTVDKKNEDDNALTNNGLANKGDRYKNTNDKVKEDGNELIAKKTNNSVNELKQTKESEANKENGGDVQAVKENENMNNDDNNNIADSGNNEADEFGMNKRAHDKKRRNKGILNKLFWGKQKSGDEEEEKSSNKHKDKYSENSQEYNNSCGDTCFHERECSSSDDMLILRTTTNKVTTTMTTTIDFHNKDQEEKLIEQQEQPEKREEWEQQIESKTSTEEQAKLNSGADETTTTSSSGNATKSGKLTHEHLSKKERHNRAKAEFALHDPLNEEIKEESTMPYERDNTAKKTKSKGEHAHHMSGTSDEFEDHMVGSVYKGSDICPYCNYPRSSSVWCSVSYRHHGNDAICAPHHSSASSGHDSGKWSAKTLFKKGKDNKKNEASCEDNDTSHLTNEKTSHPITSWLHRRHRQHHRHDGDGNDRTDDGDKSQDNYSCQSEIENSNTDDKNAEYTETAIEQTLESNNTNFISDGRDHQNVNAHDVAAVCSVKSQVCSSDQTRTHVDYTNNDIDNDIVVDKDVDNVENKQEEDSARVQEKEKSHKKVQYYYFVNENGETMYYATEVEDENANNSDGGGHDDNVANVITTITIDNHLQNENVSDINKNIDCNQDNEHILATNVSENANIDETTNVSEGQNVCYNTNDHYNNSENENNQIAEDINDNTSTETASQTSLTTTNSTEQSCKDGKKKRGFAKKIAHFFSRSNKVTSEKDKENVSHHVDPNALELNVETNVNETICDNKTNSCYSPDKEQPTVTSENNVKSAEKYDPYAADDDHNNKNIIENYNNGNNVEVQITDINEGEYTYDTKNNVYVSEKPAATTVVVTEVAYDTKVHEKKVPRLTEKEFKQRIKELCKDEKKQREVLEMEYKKESSEIKRCCRAGVEEIKRVCHNKKHNIKEQKDKLDDADDEKGIKEEHKGKKERLEEEESKQRFYDLL